MSPRLRLVSVVSAVVLSAGCSGGTASPVTVERSPVRCEAPTAPSGFTQRAVTSFDERTHRAIRVQYSGPQNRTLFAFFGLRREFTEGASPAGRARLASGASATLFRSGDSWIGTRPSEGRCSLTALIGSGFDRASFVEVLRDLDGGTS